jgi:hypothetical protein
VLLGNTAKLEPLEIQAEESAQSDARPASRIPLNPIVRQFHLVPSRLVPGFERLHLFNATTVAGCVAEVSGEESLN